MKKHFHKISRNKIPRNGSNYRVGLGGYYGPSDYSPYYAYPLVVITVHEVPPVYIEQGAPLIWTPRLLHDNYSQLMPPTEIKIAANYIGRML